MLLKWLAVLSLTFVLFVTHAHAQIDCAQLDPRASISTKIDGQVKASLATLYKIAKASGDIKGKFVIMGTVLFKLENS